MYLGSSIVYSTANTVPVVAPVGVTNNHSHHNGNHNGNHIQDPHKKEIELNNTHKLQRDIFRKKSSRIETPPPAFETTITMGNGNTSNNKTEDFNTREYIVLTFNCGFFWHVTSHLCNINGILNQIISYARNLDNIHN